MGYEVALCHMDRCLCFSLDYVAFILKSLWWEEVAAQQTSTGTWVLIPRTHVKPGAIMQISNPRASKARREEEIRESPEAPRSTGLAYVTVNNKKRNSVSNKVEEPTPKGSPASTHVLCHTRTYTHQHTYRHTWEKIKKTLWQVPFF